MCNVWLGDDELFLAPCDIVTFWKPLKRASVYIECIESKVWNWVQITQWRGAFLDFIVHVDSIKISSSPNYNFLPQAQLAHLTGILMGFV